jgi:hypothetical protein
VTWSDGVAELLRIDRRLTRRLWRRPVEVRGLVEEQHVRLGHDGPGDGDALLLAAPRAGRPARRAVREVHHLERATHRGRDCRVILAPGAKAVRDVLEDREVREEGVALEDEADPPLSGGSAVTSRPPTTMGPSSRPARPVTTRRSVVRRSPTARSAR